MIHHYNRTTEEMLNDLYSEVAIIKQCVQDTNKMLKKLTEKVARIEEEDSVYSVAEAAVYLNKTPQTVRKYIRLGKFNKVMRGCKEGILKSDLDAIKKP